MIGRVGWRVVLPVVNLLLFVALVAWGSQPVLHAALIQEGVAPDGSYSLTIENPLHPLLPLARRIAVAVNAPSFELVAFTISVMGVSNEKFTGAVLLTMPPFILFSWYLTGRWCDRRTGSLPVAVQPRRRLPLLNIGAVVTGLVLALFAYRTEYFLTGGTAGWHGETPVLAAVTYGFTGWLSLWEIMLITGALRCARATA